MAQAPPDDFADEGDYDDGPVDDYGPPVGGGGGGGGAGGGIFGPIMLFRKLLSVSAILAVIALEAAIAIQDVQMSSLSSSLMAKNSFRKRDVLVHVGASLVARAAGDDSKSKKSTASANKTLAIDCEYFQGFDVPAVTAGKARSMVYHFANSIFLCGLLWLERPGPVEASQMLGISRFSLPPIGNVGLVTFSLLEMWLASSAANHFIGTISYIAAYSLMVVGVLGLLFALVFGSKLKSVSGSAGAGGSADMMDPPEY